MVAHTRAEELVNGSNDLINTQTCLQVLSQTLYHNTSATETD